MGLTRVSSFFPLPHSNLLGSLDKEYTLRSGRVVSRNLTIRLEDLVSSYGRNNRLLLHPRYIRWGIKIPRLTTTSLIFTKGRNRWDCVWWKLS